MYFAFLFGLCYVKLALANYVASLPHMVKVTTEFNLFVGTNDDFFYGTKVKCNNFPSRQYYSYITDKQCKRLGSQAWVFLCITLSELVLNIKFGLEDLFSKTQMSMMILWIVTCVAISCVGVFVSMAVYRRRIGDVTLTVDEKDQVVEASVSTPNNHHMNNAGNCLPCETKCRK